MSELLFRDAREYLSFEYELRKARRPAYSMRAFARDLHMSPSGLNDFMKGRVGMSRKRAEEIATLLFWTDLRREHFVDLVLAKYDKEAGVRKTALMRVRSRLKDGTLGLSVDAFKAISDWYHLVILELCGVKDNLTAAEIAKELSLAPATAGKAIKRLLRLGLLATGDKGLKPVDDVSHFGDEQPSEAIIEFHSQILEMALVALKEKSMKERESHSLVYAVKSQDVATMNKEIRKAALTIINKYAQTSNADTIRILTLQIFPVWERKG